MTAIKHDFGKPRLELVPPELMVATGEAPAFGAARYGDRNWEQGLEWGRVYGALQRHLNAWWSGEDCDSGSGQSHTDAIIAQYLLTIRYRQNRLGARVTVPISARLWFVIESGEWVKYDNKTWLVTEKKNGNLTLAETSSDIYAEGGISGGPVITRPSVPINASLLTTVKKFTAHAGILTGSDMSQRPALEFRWMLVDDPSIVSILMEYRREGETETCNAIRVSLSKYRNR